MLQNVPRSYPPQIPRDGREDQIRVVRHLQYPSGQLAAPRCVTSHQQRVPPFFHTKRFPPAVPRHDFTF